MRTNLNTSPGQTMLNAMLPLLLKLALILLAVFWGLRWFEQSQVYHPSKEWLPGPSTSGLPPQDIALTAADGVALHAWFFKAAKGSPRSDMAWLFFHGNGGNLSMRGPMLETLKSLGLNLLALDYRGYGKSAGKPSESGTYLDAEAAFEWLRAQGFEAAKILVHGESLGGGVASYLASVRPVGGLVIQSSFTGMPDLGSEKYPFLPVRLVGAIQYPTRRRLPKVKAPVLIMHSRTDQIIPFHHGEANFASANEPKLFWELRAGHNDYLLVDAANFSGGLTNYLARYFPCPPAS